MPEGPETARSLDYLLSKLKREGRYPRLTNVIRFTGQFQANIDALKPALDQPLLDVFYKGKEYYLVFGIPNGEGIGNDRLIAIRAHHGMKGKWSFDHPTSAANVHFRIDFSFAPSPSSSMSISPNEPDPINDLYLYYINERFGQFDVLIGLQAIQDSLLRLADGFLGRFVLTEGQWLFNISQMGKNRLLRNVLMDQGELCSGIGNYLLAEILYAAKLHPDVTLTQLSGEEQRNLYHVCVQQFEGHYKKTLEKVAYKKKVSPAGHQIESLTRAGRKIWYCPVEQPPRG